MLQLHRMARHDFEVRWRSGHNADLPLSNRHPVLCGIYLGGTATVQERHQARTERRAGVLNDDGRRTISGIGRQQRGQSIDAAGARSDKNQFFAKVVALARCHTGQAKPVF